MHYDNGNRCSQRLTLWGHLQMNFLMVGHTHEDIDGLFGVLSHKLANCNAVTPAAMERLFLESKNAVTKLNNPTSRAGGGVDNGFLPDDVFGSRQTDCVPDFHAFMEVTLCHHSSDRRHPAWLLSETLGWLL